MPAVISWTLEGPEPPSPFRHAVGLRALTLACIARSDRNLATAVHDANQPKPYAIGPLQRVHGQDGLLRVEIGCSADWAVEPILNGLPPLGIRIGLGRTEYRFVGAEIRRQATFAQLREAGAEGLTIPLRMLTPTAHHAPGALRRTVVVPDPVLYVGSWLRRWNLFADAPFDPAVLNAVAQRVVVGAFAGGTHSVTLDRGRIFLGFVGTVDLVVLPDDQTPDPLPHVLWALARLAEYCGTGVDTMRGMGRTRIARPQGSETKAGASVPRP